jgi:GT2 family glycosyltransferase
MHISVVIPSFNTQDTLAKTLECLRGQDTDLDIEVMVIDCSEHELVKDIVSRFSGVLYEHRAKRFNPGIGRNIGASLAKGELLVFIDADVQLSRDCLANAWRHYQNGCLILGGALELNKATSHGLAAYLEHFFFNHESQRNHPACDRNNLSSAFMCFDRKLFLQQGGFSDIARMQDTELTERLKRLGYKLAFRPDLVAYQTQDSSLPKVLRKILINGQNVYAIRYQNHASAWRRFGFLMALPFISLAKTVRIIYRHLRYQSLHNKIATVMLIPPLLCAGMYWMVGFYRGVIAQDGINPNR